MFGFFIVKSNALRILVYKIFLKTFCRDDRSRNVYWAIGPVRGHLVVRE